MIISKLTIRSSLLLLACIFMSLSPLAFPQDGSRELGVRQLVKLNLLITDRSGHQVTDLRQEDFRISDEGQPQKIESFFYGETPLSYALLIDNSGSMRRLFPDVINASRIIVDANRSGDQTLLSDFKERNSIQIASRWSNDKELLMRSLQTLVPSGGTSLRDALIAVVDRLDSDKGAEGNGTRRKAIVVITDGMEKDSAATQDHLIKRLKGSDLQVFFVGLTFGLDKDNKSIFHPSEQVTAEELMKNVAAVTGGQAFSAHSAKELGNMMIELTDRMRKQYVIGYYPTKTGNKGEFHKVKIEIVNPQRKCTIVARPGYVESGK